MRRAQAADIGSVLALVGAIAELPQWSREIWMSFVRLESDRTREKLLLLGMDEAGRIRGLAAGATVCDAAELEYVWVDGECRRRGLGRTMVQRWVTWAKNAGMVEVLLEVRSSNEAATALYRRLGFAGQGTRPEYYQGPSEDALVMRLELGGGGAAIADRTGIL